MTSGRWVGRWLSVVAVVDAAPQQRSGGGGRGAGWLA